jgi:aryl-alcohol dehydrogenase-like predicted oxidoreductase
MATGPATWDYRDRFGEAFGRTYFRRYGDGVVSSVGVGTALGPATDDRDRSYREALVHALENGCNVVDTAADYRCGRSERVVGEALDRADVDRDAVLVATKGGFVPFDGARPEDPGRYVRETVVEPGLADADDLVAGQHALAPAFLEASLDRSIETLGVDAVDCYHVHEPERQLRERSREAVYDQLEAAFVALERRVAAGDVGAYGVATWEAFRVPPDHERYLALPEVVRRARRAAERAGNDTTGLGAIQVPFNVGMADAYTVRAHEGADGPRSALEFARDAGLAVFASAPLARGDLVGGLPESVDRLLAGETPAQRAINFARSAPGVTTALVGTGTTDHARAALAAGREDPMGADAFDAVFE